MNVVSSEMQTHEPFGVLKSFLYNVFQIIACQVAVTKVQVLQMLVVAYELCYLEAIGETLAFT